MQGSGISELKIKFPGGFFLIKPFPEGLPKLNNAFVSKVNYAFFSECQLLHRCNERVLRSPEYFSNLHDFLLRAPGKGSDGGYSFRPAKFLPVVSSCCDCAKEAAADILMSLIKGIECLSGMLRNSTLNPSYCLVICHAQRTRQVA